MNSMPRILPRTINTKPRTVAPLKPKEEPTPVPANVVVDVETEPLPIAPEEKPEKKRTRRKKSSTSKKRKIDETSTDNLGQYKEEDGLRDSGQKHNDEPASDEEV